MATWAQTFERVLVSIPPHRQLRAATAPEVAGGRRVASRWRRSSRRRSAAPQRALLAGEGLRAGCLLIQSVSLNAGPGVQSPQPPAPAPSGPLTHAIRPCRRGPTVSPVSSPGWFPGQTNAWAPSSTDARTLLPDRCGRQDVHATWCWNRRTPAKQTSPYSIPPELYARSPLSRHGSSGRKGCRCRRDRSTDAGGRTRTDTHVKAALLSHARTLLATNTVEVLHHGGGPGRNGGALMMIGSPPSREITLTVFSVAREGRKAHWSRRTSRPPLEPVGASLFVR